MHATTWDAASQAAFLAQHQPFAQLEPATLDLLAREGRLESYPRGARVLRAGQDPVCHLRVILEGRARLTLAGSEETFAERGPGQVIGALGLLRQCSSHLDVWAEEDLVCLLIDQERFQQLLEQSQTMALFFLKVLSESYAGQALGRLSRIRQEGASESSLFLFSAQVGDVVRRKPVSIEGTESIQAAARLMDHDQVGSVLVRHRGQEAWGILTDHDLRRAIAGRMNLALPVKEIASHPVQTLPARTVCFDAMLEMMRRNVHHLAVERDGKVEGMISGTDLMVLQGTSPLYLVHEIHAATAIEQLYDLSLQSPRVIHRLVTEGARASNITRLITLINDYVVEKLLALLEAELGPPPVGYNWLFFGSEGRQEQTFKTDQDNGLVYADPGDQKEAEVCQRYFKTLAAEAIRHLVNCGFPPCKGEVMASNPKWCQPLAGWKAYFDRWIVKPDPQELLNSTIFFDFRPGPGRQALGRGLKEHLLRQVAGQELFLRFLAKDCLGTPPALGLFKRLALEKTGDHKNRLDIKHKGLVPIVDYARVMSLRHGVAESNTLARLEEVAARGGMSPELHQSVSESYEIQMELRLLHQDQQWQEAVEPDNYLDPEKLSELELSSLKDALAVLGELRSYLRTEFQLSVA